MALLVLMTVGAAIGWLASILMRQDSVRKSLANIAIGAIGALMSYGVASEKLAVDTISPGSILLGALGATACLVVSTALRGRMAR